MRLIEDLNLIKQPFQFRHRFLQTEAYKGFYHAHQGIEFLYIHRGQGSITVGGRIYEVAGGTLVCFPPFQLHRIKMDVSPESPYERSVVVLEPSALEPYVRSFPEARLTLHTLWRGELEQPLLLTDSDSHRYLQALFDYYGSFSSSLGERHYEEFGLFAVQILQVLKRCTSLLFSPSAVVAAQPRPRFLTEQAMQWIEEHYGEEDVNLEQLARDLHVSKYHLSRTFRKETGSTLWDYVTARRLRQSCLLLSATDDSISRIAMATGYPDVSYFCQLFRRSTGRSPHKYRKELQSAQPGALPPRNTPDGGS